jgi:glycosyltransferase involved in cell wall biosynthesis
LLRRYYGCESIVIPNGVTRPVAPSANDDDLERIRVLREKGHKVVMHVGTLRAIKGIDAIIAALEVLCSMWEGDVIGVFVGKGHIRKYEAMCATRKIPAVFIGEKRNSRDYYALADVVINVSGGSGVSNSLLESLVQGTPVVCWDTPTFRQVVTHGVNGYLAEHGDIASLVERLVEALRGSLDPSVIVRSVARFDWAIVNNQWRQVIGLGRQ